jgi:hypothetical protein
MSFMAKRGMIFSKDITVMIRCMAEQEPIPFMVAGIMIY